MLKASNEMADVSNAVFNVEFSAVSADTLSCNPEISLLLSLLVPSRSSRTRASSLPSSRTLSVSWATCKVRG